MCSVEAAGHGCVVGEEPVSRTHRMQSHLYQGPIVAGLELRIGPVKDAARSCGLITSSGQRLAPLASVLHFGLRDCRVRKRDSSEGGVTFVHRWCASVQHY